MNKEGRRKLESREGELEKWRPLRDSNPCCRRERSGHFAETGEVSNKSAGCSSQENQGSGGVSWKTGWATGHPAEWYDPTYKGLDTSEKVTLSLLRGIGHLPPVRRYVYFLHAPALDLIKIGIAENVEARRKRLSRQRRCDLACIGSIEGTLADEAAWHARFVDLMVEREWFRDTPELRAAIAEALPLSTDGAEP